MLTLYDEFAGAGGSTQGAAAVPGVEPVLAANHNRLAVETHAANFPDVDHYLGDVAAADITRFPRADLFWASPSCPPWTDARGRRRDFDRSTQDALFDAGGAADGETLRARALMEEIPRYLRHWADRGRPVLAGVVENVIQCRRWDQWHRWLAEIRSLGYATRVIAFNSMHARPRVTAVAPQSRDRLYVAYWLTALGRRPDWDKWLRPRAHCPRCDTVVDAVQVFKHPGVDMGRYRQQYLYRCPRVSCRNHPVEPDASPAAAAIDWTIAGTRIGDRDEPLAPNTLARIKAGLRRYARPVLAPAGGTWRDTASPVDAPTPARTTRESDGLACPPLLVPIEARPDKTAASADAPLRTQTTRNETGLACPPLVVELRGGGSFARSAGEPLATVCARGNHHGLAVPPEAAAMVVRNNSSTGDGGEHCTPASQPLRTLTAAGHQSLVTWRHLVVACDRTGHAHPIAAPLGAVTTRDRHAIAASSAEVDVDVDLDDVRFRMLEPHEIGRAMAFADTYTVLGNKRDQVRQYGNAVTPPVAEVIVSALVEAITGEELPA